MPIKKTHLVLLKYLTHVVKVQQFVHLILHIGLFSCYAVGISHLHMSLSPDGNKPIFSYGFLGNNQLSLAREVWLVWITSYLQTTHLLVISDVGTTP